VGRRARNRWEAVDGILLLNKPAGMTSNQALQRVRRMLNARKAGHTGSLDPAATGMLPLCFGEATKVCAFLLDADKTYRVTARLGEATDTGDADGDVIATKDVPELTAEAWQEILDGFLGESMQVPPMYSALKKDGKRLYELARKGESVEREPRPVRVDSIRLLEIAGHRLVFRVRCSKGTYVRSLVEDIAGRAGTVAHTARLHRESVGDFEAAEMLDMATLEAAAEESRAALRDKLAAPDMALAGLPEVRLVAAESEQFLQGQAVARPAEAATGLVRVYGATDEFLGVGDLGGGELAPRRVFKTGEKNL
jgi:tRNA pseudouridine55 synthase